jgi:hypothetical protein
MLVVRIAAVLALLTIGVCLGLYVFTRDARFLRIAARLFRFSVMFAMLVAALYVLERLILI